MLRRCLFLALLPTSALAQDIDTFSLSGSVLDGRGTFQLTHPEVGSDGQAYAGALFTFARNPLLFEDVDGNVDAIVGSQVGLRLGGGYTVADLARIELAVPIYPLVQVEGVGRAGLGEIQLAATLELVEAGDGAFFLGVRPYAQLPTATPDAYVSGGPGAGLTLAAAGGAGSLGWTANLGALGRPSTNLGDLSLGSALNYGLGAHVAAGDTVRVGAEFLGQVALTSGSGPKNPGEVQLYGSWLSDSGFTAHVGAGTGVIGGVGAPQVRLTAGAGYRIGASKTSTAPAPRAEGDADGDGIINKIDHCVTEAEDLDGIQDGDGCPEEDFDFDGVPDEQDQCPEKEDMDGFEDDDGCPDPDNDDDGVPDEADPCPDSAGPEEYDGCPDTDGDGVLDPDDQCVDVPGDFPNMGCPPDDEEGGE